MKRSSGFSRKAWIPRRCVSLLSYESRVFRLWIGPTGDRQYTPARSCIENEHVMAQNKSTQNRQAFEDTARHEAVQSNGLSYDDLLWAKHNVSVCIDFTCALPFTT